MTHRRNHFPPWLFLDQVARQIFAPLDLIAEEGPGLTPHKPQIPTLTLLDSMSEVTKALGTSWSP